MKLKFKVDKNKMKQAVEEAKNFGSYDGPPPPPGFWTTRLSGLTLDQDKDGNQHLSARLRISEPVKINGERNGKAKYNGFTFWYRLTIPADTSNEHYNFQVRNMEDFMREASGGHYGAIDFMVIATTKGLDTENRTTRDGKTNVHVKGIGKAKITSDLKITVKSKLSDKPNPETGQPYANVSYIVRSEESKRVEESLEGKEADFDEAEDNPVIDGIEGVGDFDDFEDDVPPITDEPPSEEDIDPTIDDPDVEVDGDLLGL